MFSTGLVRPRNSMTSSKERTTMRKARRMVIPVVAVAVAMVAGPLHASAASQVPFRATLTETGVGPGPCTPIQMSFGCVIVTGTGQATHLGAITESAIVVVDFSTFDPATGCANEIRTSTFTAANGDQITLQGPGQVCGDQTQASGGDAWVVISGTGRFAGAVGSGSDSVSINRSTSPVTSVTTFSGTLSSPGSLR
jgi:hypothetical protein